MEWQEQKEWEIDQAGIVFWLNVMISSIDLLRTIAGMLSIFLLLSYHVILLTTKMSTINNATINYLDNHILSLSGITVNGS